MLVQHQVVRHSSHTNSSSRKVGSLSKQAVKTGLRQKSDRLTINLAWWLLGSAIALVWQVEVLTLRSEVIVRVIFLHIRLKIFFLGGLVGVIFVIFLQTVSADVSLYSQHFTS